MDADEEGIRIILSPVQLAAVLEGETVQEGGTVGNRVVGALRILGCAVEGVGAGALFAAPEPTMLTKAGGTLLLAHAADQCSTGGRQLWTGRDERSLLDRGIGSMAEKLGASPSAARTAGSIAEIVVPVGVGAVAGAARAGLISSGRIRLSLHEATTIGGPGGHTILKHVGQTTQQLEQRIIQTATMKKPPPMISTFDDLASAERFVSNAFRSQKAAIEAWARSGSKVNFAKEVPMGKVVGRGIERATGKLVDLRSVRIVLKSETYNGMPYYILTSFPVPP
jgi:hypothetical protein